MKYISATEYHVTMELSRDDCEMLGDACQRIANEGEQPYMEAIATMFQLAVEVTKHSEEVGRTLSHCGAYGPEIPPAFYDE